MNFWSNEESEKAGWMRAREVVNASLKDSEAPYNFARDGKLQELIVCRTFMTLDSDKLWQAALKGNHPLIIGYLYSAFDRRPNYDISLSSLPREILREMVRNNPETFGPLVRTNKSIRDTLYAPNVRDYLQLPKLYLSDIKPKTPDMFPNIKDGDVVKTKNEEYYLYSGLERAFIDIEIGLTNDIQIVYLLLPLQLDDYKYPYKYNHIFPNSIILYEGSEYHVIDTIIHKRGLISIDIGGLEWNILIDEKHLYNSDFVGVRTFTNDAETHTLIIF